MVGQALAAALTAAVIYAGTNIWAKVKKTPEGAPTPDWAENLDYGKLARTFVVGVVVGVALELFGGGITQDRYDLGVAWGMMFVPVGENILKGLYRRFVK